MFSTTLPETAVQDYGHGVTERRPEAHADEKKENGNDTIY